MDEYEAKSEFWEDDGDDRASEVDSDRVRCRRVGKRGGYKRDDKDRDLGKIKVTIPLFQGKSGLRFT